MTGFRILRAQDSSSDSCSIAGASRCGSDICSVARHEESARQCGTSMAAARLGMGFTLLYSEECSTNFDGRCLDEGLRSRHLREILFSTGIMVRAQPMYGYRSFRLAYLVVLSVQRAKSFQMAASLLKRKHTHVRLPPARTAVRRGLGVALYMVRSCSPSS